MLEGTFIISNLVRFEEIADVIPGDAPPKSWFLLESNVDQLCRIIIGNEEYFERKIQDAYVIFWKQKNEATV